VEEITFIENEEEAFDVAYFQEIIQTFVFLHAFILFVTYYVNSSLAQLPPLSVSLIL
jgi:hypothetical protein